MQLDRARALLGLQSSLPGFPMSTRPQRHAQALNGRRGELNAPELLALDGDVQGLWRLVSPEGVVPGSIAQTIGLQHAKDAMGLAAAIDNPAVVGVLCELFTHQSRPLEVLLDAGMRSVPHHDAVRCASLLLDWWADHPARRSALVMPRPDWLLVALRNDCPLVAMQIATRMGPYQVLDTLVPYDTAVDVWTDQAKLLCLSALSRLPDEKVDDYLGQPPASPATRELARLREQERALARSQALDEDTPPSHAPSMRSRF